MDVTLHSTLSGHQNPIYTLVIDSTSHQLYSAGNDKGIVEWDLTTMQFVRVLCTVPSSVYCLTLIPHTDLLAFGMRSGDVWIISRSKPELVAKLKVDKGAVFSIQTLENKQELMAIGEEGRAYVWSLSTFDLLYSFRISDTTVRTIAISADQRYVAFGDKEGTIALHDALDFHQIERKHIHNMAISSLCFMGDYLYSGGRDAKMYKLNNLTLEKEIEVVPHMFTVYGIQPLAGTKLLSTVSRDKTIKIWNEDLKLQKNISRDKGIESHFLSINNQAFDSHLGLLATAGDDKAIKMWKVEGV